MHAPVLPLLALLLCRFINGLTWAHAPVELTRIFDAKVKAFMKTVLKAGSASGVLGRVTDYVIRYEVGRQPGCAP